MTGAPHLRFAGRAPAEQEAALAAIVGGHPILEPALQRLGALSLPDGWLVAGAIYQSVWNHLTDRPPTHGLKDIDLIYFEASDLSYEAEDRVITRVADAFAGFPVPVETRNQARVHLWFERRFGIPVPPLTSAPEALTRYAALTHAVAIRPRPQGGIEIVAPFGLDLIFNFRLAPNPRLDNSRTYAEKGTRMKALWPELTVEPWPGS
jgi:uncharacterized protein